MHIPVLQKEVIQYLDPKPNENFIDCTTGFGGHALAILERNGPKGKVLGIDWDKEVVSQLKSQTTKFKNRFILANDSFTNLKEIVRKEKSRIGKIQGILLDLGMSSWHLEGSQRGFSFLRKEPLDMRYNTNQPLTAEKIINYWSEAEIEKILSEYGEERFARNIAKEIIADRKFYPVKTTSQLISIIQKAVPSGYQRQGIHFATRTFQALRIAVNDELNNLRKVLPESVEVLSKGGRLAVISFHSLEDRIVKEFFKEKSQENILQILTKKPITPTREEIINNPRSRSSKLRIAVKTIK